MTVYICQIPHRLPARCWSADSDATVIDLIADDFDEAPAFASAIEAARYDMRAAYVTDDPLDLFHWIEFSPEAPSGAKPARAFFDAFERDIEELARQVSDPTDPEDVAYSAFDGRFLYREATMEWSLGNARPRAATSLAEALCLASVEMKRQEVIAI